MPRLSAKIWLELRHGLVRAARAPVVWRIRGCCRDSGFHSESSSNDEAATGHGARRLILWI